MKKSLSLILIMLSLVSCKMEGANSNQNKEITGFGGMEVPESKNFTAPEIQIGKRICSLLEGKRKMLESYRNNQKQQLIFTAEAKSCGQALTNSMPAPFRVYVELASTDYEFIAPTRNGDYFRDVVTRDNTIMDPVCDSLSGTGEIARQYSIASHNVTIKFLVQNSMDKVEITQYSPAAKGGYSLAYMEGISFIGSTKQGPAQVFGLEKERVRYKPCSGKQTPSSLKQTFVDLTTIL